MLNDLQLESQFDSSVDHDSSMAPHRHQARATASSSRKHSHSSTNENELSPSSPAVSQGQSHDLIKRRRISESPARNDIPGFCDVRHLAGSASSDYTPNRHDDRHSATPSFSINYRPNSHTRNRPNDPSSINFISNPQHEGRRTDFVSIKSERSPSLATHPSTVPTSPGHTRTPETSLKNESHTFGHLNSLTEEANYDPELFIAKHFLDEHGESWPHKTLLPIALPLLIKPKTLSDLAKDIGLSVRSCVVEGKETVVLGWNEKMVTDAANMLDDGSL